MAPTAALLLSSMSVPTAFLSSSLHLSRCLTPHSRHLLASLTLPCLSALSLVRLFRWSGHH